VNCICSIPELPQEANGSR